MRSLRVLVPAAVAAAVLLPIAAPPAQAQTPASPAAVAALQRKLQSAFATSTARSAGVAVDITGVGAVYRLRPTNAVPPASTEKLYTSFAALRAMGAGARYTTKVVAGQPQVGSKQPGNLWLIGVGDPSLTTTDLDHLASAVAATGTKTVLGRLYVDDTRYDRAVRAPGWKTEWVPEESGPLSALSVDGNRYRTDRAYLADPATANLERFRALLVKRGVAVSTYIGRAPSPAGARVVASHLSRPLSSLVTAIAKNSDNFGAELLVKELGKIKRNAGTTRDGARAVLDTLHAMGVTDGGFVDGSGLSTLDRQTPLGEVSLLAAAERSGVYSQLRGALPIACTDGTLKRRMCGTAAAGKVVAKTGTLDTVRALTGWTTTADGRVVRFSFLMAGFTSGSKANAAMDAAAVALASANLS